MGSSGSTDFTYEDVPDQTGKTVLITGANLGLGFALTGDYINKTKAAKVIMACRSKEKCEEAMKKLGNDPRLCFLQLDLSDFDSVKKAAKDLYSILGTSKLDALILNAGALNLTKASTKQGLEATMGVCHFGHFLFTALAWPMLSAEARIVPVSSVGHTWTKKGIDFEDLNWEKRDYDAYEAYFQAKLANVYFTKEIGRRCEAQNLQITAVTLSPGFGKSGLYRDFSGWQDYLTSFISEENEKLSINTMRAATDMTLKNGDYLVPKRFGFYGPPVVTPPSDLSEDADIAKQLWKVSEEITGQKFDIGGPQAFSLGCA